MKNKPLIAGNLECLRKQIGLRDLGRRGRSVRERGPGGHGWRLEAKPPGPNSGKGSKKDVKKCVRSRNMYENKGTQDTMSENNQTFRPQFSTFTSNRTLFCRKLLLLDDGFSDQFGFLQVFFVHAATYLRTMSGPGFGCGTGSKPALSRQDDGAGDLEPELDQHRTAHQRVKGSGKMSYFALEPPLLGSKISMVVLPPNTPRCAEAKRVGPCPTRARSGSWHGDSGNHHFSAEGLTDRAM